MAPFPSMVEFMRAINFGSANLKNGMRLNFECFEEEEYFGHELPMVWMRVLNLPKVLRAYQVLWAVGTLLGATQKVDMISTRKNKFGRFKVAVLNPTILPTTMDCVIGTRFLELQFEVEPFMQSGEATGSGSKDGPNGEDNGNANGDTEMEDANKKTKKMDFSAAKENKQHKNSAAGQQHDVERTLDDFDDDDLLDDAGKGQLGDTFSDSSPMEEVHVEVGEKAKFKEGTLAQRTLVPSVTP